MKKYLLISLIVVSVSVGAYGAHLWWSNKYNKLTTELQKAQTENLQHVLNEERLQREKADAISAKIAAEKTALETKEKVIIKEVTRYVQSNDNAQCELDDDWVHISDAATPVPRITETLSTTNGTSKEVRDLGEALRVITNNYNACQDSVNRLQAWQEWYESVSRK